MSKHPYQVLPPHSAAELAALRDSIAANGLQVPVLLDTKGNIIDGHVRAMICDELGINWHDGAIVQSGLSPMQCKALAITLNLARRSAHPSRKQRVDYARTMLIAHPDMSDAAIAKVVGYSQQRVNDFRRQLTKSGKLRRVRATVGTDGVRRKIPARLLVRSRREYDKCAPIIEAMSLVGKAHGLVRHPDRLQKEYAQHTKRSAAQSYKGRNLAEASALHCDFRKLNIKPGSVDLVMTDVVWSGAAKRDWIDCAKLAKTWLSDDGLFASWIGQRMLPEFLDAMRTQLHYHWTFIALFGATVRNRPLGIIESYRPVVVFSKRPNIRLGFCRDTINMTSQEKDYHEWQQSLYATAEIIRRLKETARYVVDPFCGSGTTLVACRQLGIKGLGCDIDAKAVKIARYRIATEGKRKAG